MGVTVWIQQKDGAELRFENISVDTFTNANLKFLRKENFVIVSNDMKSSAAFNAEEVVNIQGREE